MFADDAAVAAIGAGLLDRTLPKSAWTHEGHFAAALWLLAHRPLAELSAELPGLIRAYNLATGGANTVTEGYHETITQASLRAAAHFADTHVAARQGAPRAGSAALVNALLATRLGHPDWLLDHWSRACLFSVAARRAWCPPDLHPLPF
jgi:hypothetical protein